jgi:hypothetical protein
MPRCFRAYSLLGILLAGLLGATPQADAASGETPPNWNLYLKIKTVGSKLANGECLPRCGLTPQENDVNLLVTCAPWSEFFDASEFSTKENRQLLDIAGYVYEWHYLLSHAGYPSLIWQSQLQAIEKALVSRAGTEADDELMHEAENRGRALVAAAEEYRKETDKKLPKVYYVEECGAGGPVDVIMKSSPPGGAINIISQFEYELCTLDHTSSNILSCNGWRRVKSDGKEKVSGIYYISVQWSERISAPTKYNFDDAEPGRTYELP